MKTFLIFCIGLLVLTISIVLMIVAYMLFDEARDTWELNKKLRAVQKGESDEDRRMGAHSEQR